MRNTDTQKIERVKEAALKLIVSKGYHGASIAEIAKAAQVSDGYLYRHYANKADLVKDIYRSKLKAFHDFIYELLDADLPFKELLKRLITHLFAIAKEEPETVQFIFMMIHDHDFDYPHSRLLALRDICVQLLERGKREDVIGSNHKAEDVLIVVFSLPVKLIEARRKGVFTSHEITSVDVENITDICLNALR
ncbi:MAG: TetR/AcrR family transcriptional regulator [FCB group bacterium]|nr:TetR/AcrR family transcriptional regulator [FCB group bacterium]